ncbi:MAG: hypothetical protein ACJ8AW_14460 [Rhodopila sp.]
MIRSVLACILLLAPALAAAQPAQQADPDWPCQQIKVPSLSLAAVWSGPPVDPAATPWRRDEAVSELVSQITPRRVPIDRAQSMIDSFAAHSGDQRQQRLLSLIAGVYTELDEERSSVIAGLSRFGTRQKELAAAIRSDNEELRAMQTNSSTDAKAVQAMTQKVTWEAEVFQDRSRAITFACEVPAKIEQRFFALAHQIQKDLE